MIYNQKKLTSFDLFQNLKTRLTVNDIIEPAGLKFFNLISAIENLEKKIKALPDDSPACEKRVVLEKLVNPLVEAVDMRLNCWRHRLFNSNFDKSERIIKKAFESIDNADDQRKLAKRRDIYKSVVNVALCVIAIGIPILVGWVYKAWTGKNLFTFFTNTHSQDLVDRVKDSAEKLEIDFNSEAPWTVCAMELYRDDNGTVCARPAPTQNECGYLEP